jgi:hypothetical protein
MRIGFELEMSDIVTSDAAEIVYGDRKLLPDYSYSYDKPKLDYSVWNLVPDSTIVNSDGSVCMKSYVEDGQLVKAFNGRFSPDRFKWKGAELISPVFEEDKIDYTSLENFLTQFKEHGAVFSGDLCNALHIHIDISELTSLQVREIVTMIYLYQPYLEGLGSSWSGSRQFSDEEIKRLWETSTIEDWWTEYCTIKGKQLKPNRIGVRRFIDVGNYFNDIKDFKTIEFRCFRAVGTVEYVMDCIVLSQYLLEMWTRNTPPENAVFLKKLVKRVKRHYDR